MSHENDCFPSIKDIFYITETTANIFWLLKFIGQTNFYFAGPLVAKFRETFMRGLASPGLSAGCCLPWS